MRASSIKGGFEFKKSVFLLFPIVAFQMFSLSKGKRHLTAGSVAFTANAIS